MLPNVCAGETFGRASRTAASALLGRVYLQYAATLNHPEAYSNAITYLEKAVTLSSYGDLGLAYSKLFAITGQNDPEVIFPIMYIANEAEHSNFATYFQPLGAKDLTSAAVGRGWNIGQAQLYGLGYYSGDPEPFISYCMLSGIERHQISFYLDNLEAYHEPRITIPARNSKGFIHSVYGRLIDDNEKSHTYITYASGPTVIPFNIQPDSENPIIVQGFFDALTADLAGIPGVVSTMYQELNVNHLYKLKACGAEAFTVILRREEDRRNQELKIQKYLKLAEQMHMSLKSIVLPKDETVDTFVRKNGADKLLDLISKTEVDTIHSHRRSMLLQDIKENFDTAMACPPDQSVGYKLSTFPKLTQEIDGVQSGCFFVSSHPFGLKTFLLSSLTLDLIESNPNLKVIYVAYETPRRQIFDRLVSMLIGQSILTVRKQNTDNEINKKILDATRDLMGYVRNNRLEIWDDMPSLDFSDLLKTLSQELKDHPDLILVIDGIDHMKITDRPELPDIHEKRSSIMLDLYKALDIPIFLGGELIDSNMGLLGPRAYLRDSDAIYWLTEKDGVLNLSVDSRRLGSSRIYENKISMDPQSSRMKEA